MLKNVIFCSQAEIEKRTGWADWSVISITGSKFYEANLKFGWHSVLRIVFDDVDVEDGPYLAITDEQAEQIVDFVIREAESSEVNGIVVHCAAGISRSAAVARWVATAYNLPFNECYQNDNRLVYSKLLNAGMLRDTVSWAASQAAQERQAKLLRRLERQSPFLLYSEGKMGTRQLMEATGIDWFGDVLVELGKRGLKLPRFDSTSDMNDEQKAMLDRFSDLAKANKDKQ